jgi:valyl-tRNA synthetase
MNLPKAYEANKYEKDIYLLWEASNAFAPRELDQESLKQSGLKAEDSTFSVTMPPPNATGTLHLGHTLMLAIQDTIVRYQRMKGKSVLYLPGTDHAAIPVNAIMEKKLADEGLTKHDIGRDEFIRRTKDFVANSQDHMRSQIRLMGTSCDWSRERYTLDPGVSRIVSDVFVKMFNSGIIYRGSRIVNWDPVLETNISDDEVVYKDETTTLYTFKYGPFNISTSRPETKFGDKYVVVHPDDERYAEFTHGDTFECEWINGPVLATVLKDDVIDMSFGTGAMTITPWHDHVDFDLAERHKLDKEQIIDFKGNLLPVAGEFAGMHISEARPLIVEKLRSKSLVVEEQENYKHSVAVNERGKAVIEPQIRLQWFVDVNAPAMTWKGQQMSLKQVMRAVIDDGDVQILPERFNKIYFSWIDNLRDWCVSRQIWWGHRVPVWFRTIDGQTETYSGVKPPVDDSEWGKWEQDQDTLDTWFSSALWTWSTLIDPEKATDLNLSLEDLLKLSPDYQKFHPTSLMETGYDIIFQWVARMILATTFAVGEVPFKKVYLHGLVKDATGAKMSKSRPETAIEPAEVVEKYGADALRLAMLNGLSPGNDQSVYDSKIASQAFFCNKLWNIARYIEGRLEAPADVVIAGSDPQPRKNEVLNNWIPNQVGNDSSTPADHWILQRFNTVTAEVATLLDACQLSLAYEKVYHLIWDDLADWYIEASKVQENTSLLVPLLEWSLKLAHPFAPFVTEAIWQTLSWQPDTLLMSQLWPQAVKFEDEPAQVFENLKLVTTEVRNINAVLSVNGTLMYHEGSQWLQDGEKLVKKLARVKSVAQVESGKGLYLTSVSDKIWLALDESEITAFKDHHVKQLASLRSDIAKLEGRLSNDSYVKNAPDELVAETRKEAETKRADAAKLEADISKHSE